MKSRAILLVIAVVLVFIAGASWFYKLRPSSATAPSAIQASQAVPRLEDSYARVALFALIKIESDDSVPVEREGAEYANLATLDAIDRANAGATTSDEEAMTKLLSKLYADKLRENQYQDMIFHGPSLNDKQTKAVVDAQIAIVKKDKPCVEAFDSALRARESRIPSQCSAF